MKYSCSELNLNEIQILKEFKTKAKLSTLGSILESFMAICSNDLRCETLKIIGIYSCLQIGFKGFLYIITAIFATDMCESNHKVWGQNRTENLAFGQKVGCATLEDSDLINGVILSLAFYASTIMTTILVKKVGEYWSMKFLAVASLFFSVPILFCLPSVFQLLSMFVMFTGIAGISLVFFIILPQIYPTIARNSGFGLVDGVGKIVASLAVYAITTTINYSLRGAIGLLIGIMGLLLVQVLALNVENISETVDDLPNGTKLNSAPHQD